MDKLFRRTPYDNLALRQLFKVASLYQMIPAYNFNLYGEEEEEGETHDNSNKMMMMKSDAHQRYEGGRERESCK